MVQLSKMINRTLLLVFFALIISSDLFLSEVNGAKKGGKKRGGSSSAGTNSLEQTAESIKILQ